MSPEKTQELYDRFPDLYRGRIKPDTESLMCYGFECGNGWFDLIAELSQRIADITKAAGLTGDAYPEATQVKEKYGGLRFYTETVSDAVQDAISEACERSFSVCEVCSRPGKTAKSRHRVRTLCENCKGN